MSFFNPFHGTGLFLNPLKISERDFQTLSGGLERDQLHKMGPCSGSHLDARHREAAFFFVSNSYSVIYIYGFRILSNIYDGAFYEKFNGFSAVNYFCKRLNLRYLTGF